MRASQPTAQNQLFSCSRRLAFGTASTMLKKARKMAGEFQGQMDELVKEANLQEVPEAVTAFTAQDRNVKGIETVQDLTNFME